MCVCVCMYIHVCMYVHMYLCVCIYIYIYTLNTLKGPRAGSYCTCRVYMYNHDMYMYIQYMYVYMYICVYFIYAYVYIPYIHVYIVYVCIYVYMCIFHNKYALQCKAPAVCACAILRYTHRHTLMHTQICIHINSYIRNTRWNALHPKHVRVRL